MTTTIGTVTEDIGNTIRVGQKVYDKDNKRVGSVDFIYRTTGYMLVETNPFSDGDLYIPFRLITNIDPRELYLSASKDELHRAYADPPPRSTRAIDQRGSEIAVTTEASGYTGATIVVDAVRIDELKDQFDVGDVVYTADLQELGTIKRYDPMTGWFLVKRDMSSRHDLLLPVTILEDVDTNTRTVYLALSLADLERMQHREPADVVFVQTKDIERA